MTELETTARNLYKTLAINHKLDIFYSIGEGKELYFAHNYISIETKDFILDFHFKHKFNISINCKNMLVFDELTSKNIIFLLKKVIQVHTNYFTIVN